MENTEDNLTRVGRIPSFLLLPADDAGREKMRENLSRLGAEPTVIGRSILGRDIECYRIGRGREYALYLGAHHALESVTANILYTLMYFLLSDAPHPTLFGVDSERLLNMYTFCIVPTVNPDGIEMRLHGASGSPLFERVMRMSGGVFDSWQANARGVDLNHNYAAGFFEYKRIEAERGISPGASLYSGEFPESEPESRAVANLLRVLEPKIILSLHSQGEEIYFGPRAKDGAVRGAERISRLTGYALSAPTGTALYGGLSDYSASLGIPSYTLEVGKGKNPLPESDIPRIFERLARALVLAPSLV